MESWSQTTRRSVGTSQKLKVRGALGPWRMEGGVDSAVRGSGVHGGGVRERVAVAENEA